MLRLIDENYDYFLLEFFVVYHKTRLKYQLESVKKDLFKEKSNKNQFRNKKLSELGF